MPTKHNLKDLEVLLKESEEDSPDLTDAEVTGALPAFSPTDIAKHLEKCSECGALLLKVQYAVRRRKPKIYWRVVWSCEKGHENRLVFRIDYEA